MLREPFHKIFQKCGPCGHIKGALLQNSQNSRRVGRVVSCRSSCLHFVQFVYFPHVCSFSTVGPILLAIFVFFCWFARPSFLAHMVDVCFWPQPTLIFTKSIFRFIKILLFRNILLLLLLLLLSSSCLCIMENVASARLFSKGQQSKKLIN